MSVVRIDIARRHRLRKKMAMRALYITGIVLICLLITGAVRGKDKVITGYEYKKTDTLWELLEYCPEDMDRWEYLYEIMELNGMDDMTVQANRLYMVPVFSK